VTQDTAASYQGSSLPTQQASFDTHLSLFHGTLSLGALFTYQGGYKVYNSFALQQAENGVLEAQNVAGAPLSQQARAIAINEYYYTPAGFLEDGSVLRFQELSLTYALPARWARKARVRALSLTGAVRNLAYWTRYTGGDPGASSVSAQGTVSGTNVTYAINNDLRSSNASAVPLARYFQFRLNVGF
jgi:hypothetical protein